MQFTDREHTSLRSSRSVQIDKPYIPSLAPLMRCRLRTVNGPLQTVCHFLVHMIRTDRKMDYIIHTHTYFIVTSPNGLFRIGTGLLKCGCIEQPSGREEDGSPFPPPSPLQWVTFFLIIERRVRRVGHFIKKTTCKQNYNEKYRQCSCVEVLFPYLSPTFI